jgi:hypothetical protein
MGGSRFVRGSIAGIRTLCAGGNQGVAVRIMSSRRGGFTVWCKARVGMFEPCYRECALARVGLGSRLRGNDGGGAGV